MKDVGKLRAATLLAHGNNDFNVMTKHAAQLYEALKAPDVLLSFWLTRYLWNHENGVEDHPRSWVVRTDACPPRQSTVVGEHVDTATLTVADASPFRIGFTRTVPQAGGNVTRVITNISGTTLTLAGPVTQVADGATVSLVCGDQNPTPYPEWPDPASAGVTLHPTPGGLTFTAGSGPETLVDDAGVTATALMNAASEDSRLLYLTNPLRQPVRISGTPRMTLKSAFSRAKANLTALLVSLPARGNGTILTRGWIDPENRTSDWTTEPVTPGELYRLSFHLQPKDVIVAAGRRLGLMVISATATSPCGPPRARRSRSIWRRAASRSRSSAAPPRSCPPPAATSSRARWAGQSRPRSRRPSAARRASAPSRREWRATTPPRWPRRSSPRPAMPRCPWRMRAPPRPAGWSTARSPLPHLFRRAWAQPRSRPWAVRRWRCGRGGGPVSNDAVTIDLRQSIAADEPLRTGTYAKTLTFTLSTTP